MVVKSVVRRRLGLMRPWALPIALGVAISTPLLAPGGLGLKGGASSTVERDQNWNITKWTIKQLDSKTTWDWLSLLVFPAGVAVIGGLIQRQLSRQAMALQRQIHDQSMQVDKDRSLQLYFDRIASLVLEKNLIALSKQSEKQEDVALLQATGGIIRAQTLSILRMLKGDKQRTQEVITLLAYVRIPQAMKIPLDGLDLSKINLGGALLDGISLVCADFSYAYLYLTVFNNANCKRAIFSGADMRRSRLCDAELQQAVFLGTDLTDSFLERAKLQGAILNEGILERALMFDAGLSEAKLIGANLRNAHLTRAILTGADLSNADLTGALLNDADLADIKWSATTKWPSSIAFTGVKNLPNELRQELGM
jgi:uncharacterized protein YjbI with pentapeptide repeats